MILRICIHSNQSIVRAMCYVYSNRDKIISVMPSKRIYNHCGWEFNRWRFLWQTNKAMEEGTYEKQITVSVNEKHVT